MGIDKRLNFEAELKKFFHKRLYLLFWVAFIFFPLFLILDYFVVNEHFESFFTIRLMVSLSLLILLFILSRPISKNHPFPLATAGLVCCGGAISMMVIQTGGHDSYYYVGMICVFIAFASILPLNLYQSVFSGSLIYLIYILPIVAFSSAGPGDWLIFFNNNFFFLFFIIVSAVKSHEDFQSRQKEFALKKDLNYYAGNLEQEVRRRIKKHEESEFKYKELYENILDSLVVMDLDGKILMANPKFFQLIGDNRNKKPSFLKFVHPDDIKSVKNLMLNQLFAKTEIRNFYFRLVNIENKTIDMECSAKKLLQSGKLIGYQLVLRDITARKRLQKDLVTSFNTLNNTRAATIMGLAKLTEYRDHETGLHLERIQKYAKILAEELSHSPHFHDYISQKYVDDIHLSSILHDIGKVGIPDSILLKPAQLDAREFEIIKQHCLYGGDALKAVESKISGESFLTLGREIAYYHHEKWDGTGYPKGIKNNKIPLSARIIAVCDVYDALTSKRIYKEAYSHDRAVEIIQSERGKHFDPRVTDAFLAKSDEFDLIRKHLEKPVQQL